MPRASLGEELAVHGTVMLFLGLTMGPAWVFILGGAVFVLGLLLWVKHAWF